MKPNNCPFCGCVAKIRGWEWCVRVECEYHPCLFSGPHKHTEAEAIAAWNKITVKAEDKKMKIEKTMDVLEAIAAMIREKGYDGLCNYGNDHCGCLLEDLAPCLNMSINCSLGYRGLTRDEEGNVTWAIFETKDEAEKSKGLKR